MITEQQARVAYKQACEALGVPAHEDIVVQGGAAWPAGPVLCEDFEDRGIYAIVWDGGSYWSNGDNVTEWWSVATDAAGRAAGVYAEPFNHWSVALYPA